MLKNLKIKFTINPYRKHKPSNFNPKISKYWSEMYYAMFSGVDSKEVISWLESLKKANVTDQL